MSPSGRPIETYLDKLFGELSSADPATGRRLVDEAEAHLLESAAEFEATGLSRVDAERAAVERFGPPELIAGETYRTVRARPADLVLATLRPAAFLVGAGLVAVGVSGGVAAAMNALFGRDFVGSLHQTYSSATCEHFLSVQPAATTCSHAAVLETSYDAVALRLLAGVLGLAVLAGWWVWRKRSARLAPELPPIVVPTIGFTAFAIAAVALAAQSADLAATYGADGVGFYLSGAVAAALGCLAFAIPMVRRLLDATEQGESVPG